jgi:hypothetical protein
MGSRLFGYNSGATVSGASQSGNLAVSNDSRGGGSVQWWNGPDEDLGYVIGYTDTTGLRKANGTLIGGNAVGFIRTLTKTDAEFLSLSNSLTGQGFMTASVAVNWLNTNGYYTSYSVSSNLGTLGNPAVSAQAIYNSGQTTDGWYYIQTSNMGSPIQIYCNMTDQGGGWMLMTYNPDNTTNSGIPYPNQWLGGTGSFGSKISIDTRQVWYHSGTAQCTQVMKMATATASLTPLLTNMQIANKVVYTNPNNLKLSATFSTTLNNNTPMTGTWSGIKGHTLMSIDLAINAPGDWIFAANVWWTVCGPSTQLSVDGRSPNGQGSGSWTNISSTFIYGMADVSNTTTSNRGDIKTYAVYIK